MVSQEENCTCSKDNMIAVIKNLAADDLIIEESEVGTRVRISNSIFVDDLLKVVETITEYEAQDDSENIFLDLKELNTEKLAEVFRLVLPKDDLKDPLLILNIINLIKVYNSLDDTFFQNPDIYFNSIEDLLDLKLEISSELAEFTKKVGIYFISLFKSYNKFHYAPNDKHCKLPTLFKTIFLSTDLLTLSGVFSDAEHFDTSECMMIDDAMIYLTSLLMKGSMSFEMIEMFLRDKEGQK